MQPTGFLSAPPKETRLSFAHPHLMEGPMDIDRRAFLASVGGLAVVERLDPEARAEALEHYMMEKLDEEAGGLILDGEAQLAGSPPDATIRRGAGGLFAPQGPPNNRRMPALAPMSDKPTLVEFFEKRFAPANHVLQSATRALKTGMSEEIVLACLLHDVVLNLVKVDHGWWGAQMIEPYVPEKVSWAIRYHQALRFYPDPANGYEYPELYNQIFGKDYVPQPHIKAAYEYARNHKWYIEARMVTVNDLYAFRSECQGLNRAVPRHRRPALQAAQGGPGERQQPDRPHVADDDVPDNPL
jgi:hypothetical protein